MAKAFYRPKPLVLRQSFTLDDDSRTLRAGCRHPSRHSPSIPSGQGILPPFAYALRLFGESMKGSDCRPTALFLGKPPIAAVRPVPFRVPFAKAPTCNTGPAPVKGRNNEKTSCVVAEILTRSFFADETSQKAAAASGFTLDRRLEGPVFHDGMRRELGTDHNRR